MPRQSKGTALKQLNKTEFLIVSGKTQKSTVNAQLAKAGLEILGERSGEATPAPDWNQLQEWGITALELSAGEVRRTDRQLRKSRVRLTQARRNRKAELRRIASSHRALRKSFAGTYGRDALPLVGLDCEPTPALLAVREQMREQMREVITRMEDPQLVAALPEPLAGQQPIDLAALAETRSLENDDLEAQGAEIYALRKHTDESLIVRNTTLARNRRVYANVGRLLEGIYRLAGLDELADRIRVTQRSSRKKPADAREGESTAAPKEPVAEPGLSPAPPEQTLEGGESVIAGS